MKYSGSTKSSLALRDTTDYRSKLVASAASHSLLSCDHEGLRKGDDSPESMRTQRTCAVQWEKRVFWMHLSSISSMWLASNNGDRESGKFSLHNNHKKVNCHWGCVEFDLWRWHGNWNTHTEWLVYKLCKVWMSCGHPLVTKVITLLNGCYTVL